jgi:hypothetical protein
MVDCGTYWLSKEMRSQGIDSENITGLVDYWSAWGWRVMVCTLEVVS